MHWIMQFNGFQEKILEWIELVSLAIEIIAITIIAVVVITSTFRYFAHTVRSQATSNQRYTAYRHSLARSLLLGLEILVAADIIRTVALEPTFKSVGVLGMLVLIRIILGWSLTVEVEGRWPWQPVNKDKIQD